jgi:hypothetical protein
MISSHEFFQLKCCISFIHATCPTHLALIDLITIVKLGEEFELCNFLQVFVTVSLIDLNIHNTYVL